MTSGAGPGAFSRGARGGYPSHKEAAPEATAVGHSHAGNRIRMPNRERASSNCTSLFLPAIMCSLTTETGFWSMNESRAQQPGGTVAEGNGGTPWGFFATTGLAAIVVMVSLLVVLLVTVGYWFTIALLQPDVDPDHLDALLDSDLALSLVTCGVGGVSTLTILLLARLHRGISVHEYLAY